MKVAKKSKLDHLETPEWVWKPLGPFDLDPCAGSKTSIGTVNFRGECVDGLDGIWPSHMFAWINPPFSQKEHWIKKAINHDNGILILPERGSAPWFGPLAKKCGRYFVMGKKINFIGGPSSNNLGSVLFPFGDKAVIRIEESDLPGHMVKVKWFQPREEQGRKKLKTFPIREQEIWRR